MEPRYDEEKRLTLWRARPIWADFLRCEQEFYFVIVCKVLSMKALTQCQTWQLAWVYSGCTESCFATVSGRF